MENLKKNNKIIKNLLIKRSCIIIIISPNKFKKGGAEKFIIKNKNHQTLK